MTTFVCYKCKKNILSGSNTYYANDKSYCSEKCRLSNVYDINIRRELLNLNIHNNKNFKSHRSCESFLDIQYNIRDDTLINNKTTRQCNSYINLILTTLLNILFKIE